MRDQCLSGSTAATSECDTVSEIAGRCSTYAGEGSTAASSRAGVSTTTSGSEGSTTAGATVSGGEGSSTKISCAYQQEAENRLSPSLADL